MAFSVAEKVLIAGAVYKQTRAPSTFYVAVAMGSSGSEAELTTTNTPGYKRGPVAVSAVTVTAAGEVEITAGTQLYIPTAAGTPAPTAIRLSRSDTVGSSSDWINAEWVRLTSTVAAPAANQPIVVGAMKITL